MDEASDNIYKKTTDTSSDWVNWNKELLLSDIQYPHDHNTDNDCGNAGVVFFG